MLQVSKLSLLVSAALASANANAILYPEGELPESEYKDYLVKLEFLTVLGQTSNCGGLLVGGEYVITADHCTWGATGDLRIVQGVDTSDDTKATIVGFEHLGDDSTYRSLSDAFETASPWMWDNWAARAGEFGLSEITAIGHFVSDSRRTEQDIADYVQDKRDQDPDYTVGYSFEADTAVLKLDQVLAQNDSVVIGKMIEADGTSMISNGTVMQFAGWGVDDSDTIPTRLKTMSLTMEFNWSVPFEMVDTGDVYDYDSSLPLMIPTPCTNAASACSFGPEPWDLYSATNVGNSITDGDSGTPIVHEGRALGLVSKAVYEGVYTKKSALVNFNYADAWLAHTIGDVLFPKSVDLVSNADGSYTFTIQNFSEESVDVTLPNGLALSEGVTVTQGCELTLANSEHCEVVIAYSAIDIDAVVDVPVYVTTDKTMQLTLRGKAVEPEVEVPEIEVPEIEDPTLEYPETDVPANDADDSVVVSGGGSSGGSFGWLSLLGLSLLTLRRKR